MCSTNLKWSIFEFHLSLTPEDRPIEASSAHQAFVAARSIEIQRSRIPSSVNKSPSSDGMLGAQSRNMEAEVHVEMLCGILQDGPYFRYHLTAVCGLRFKNNIIAVQRL